MSVINQMLKDLDKRQEPVSSNSHVVVPNTSAKYSSIWTIVITVLMTLTLVVLAYLYVENKALKENALGHETSSLKASEADENVIITSHNPTFTLNTAESSNEKNTLEKKQGGGANVQEVLQPKVKSFEAEKSSKVIPQEVQAEPLNSVHLNEKGSPLNHGVLTQSVNNAELNNSSDDIENVQQIPAPKKQTSLNISRKKLSPAELAAKKMTQAEQAVLNQDIKLAEQYLEEILLIESSHHAARKQLAALLYGRQSIQEAINILSQGIYIAPDDSELRLMLARIYTERGFNQQALNTLRPLADTLDVGYQSAIATNAQSLAAHQEAINAFKHLIKLQQGQSRWYLGLGVSYDRLGQYPQAVDAYQQAIIVGNLSESALAFAKQRTLELGDS